MLMRPHLSYYLMNELYFQWIGSVGTMPTNMGLSYCWARVDCNP